MNRSNLTKIFKSDTLKLGMTAGVVESYQDDSFNNKCSQKKPPPARSGFSQFTNEFTKSSKLLSTMLRYITACSSLLYYLNK